jgi:hypothetical protein
VKSSTARYRGRGSQRSGGPRQLARLRLTPPADRQPRETDRGQPPGREGGTAEIPFTADLLLTNANVVTMDPARPRAWSVATAGGGIVAVDDDDVRARDVACASVPAEVVQRIS